jgi:hypothetical protein
MRSVIWCRTVIEFNRQTVSRSYLFSHIVLPAPAHVRYVPDGDMEADIGRVPVGQRVLGDGI